MLHPAAAAPWVMHEVTQGVKPYVALVAVAGALVVPVALVDATLCEALVALPLPLAFADEVVDDWAPTETANPTAARILKGMNMAVECFE